MLDSYRGILIFRPIKPMNNYVLHFLSLSIYININYCIESNQDSILDKHLGLNSLDIPHCSCKPIWK